MEKYIKPEIKVKRIELENGILAGSIDVPISDDPATDPALSKGSSFTEEDNTVNSGSSPSALWDD